ncbi:uncharacterized protein LOC118361090 [Oncorhynchus keta]|uniref:uncharacterized protein LOC118361090 n=1 Tax=Oncorhynchus keta TaxID=8018 RepID=UPI00227C46EE|nr:uncharacterized protein LOC118361090 [Oncorhynchus keta]
MCYKCNGKLNPPQLLFSYAKGHFVWNEPIGCVGSGNGSGWMQEDDFFIFLEHAKHTKVSLERKEVLHLDNHRSHLSISSIDFCRRSGIVLLSFPQHRSHKLQPLDRSVYGPLKKMMNSASDAWMRVNSRKAMTIYDIPGLPGATTPTNIQAGFRFTGIWPYNLDIFQECDFAPSLVTDHPAPADTMALPAASQVTSSATSQATVPNTVQPTSPAASQASSPAAF